MSSRSTAEIFLPYDASVGEELDRARELLEQAKDKAPAGNEGEPLFGTTFRSVMLGFKGTDTPGNEKLFGNRIRWVARTFREARDQHNR
jgi:hypothetical protein